MTKITLNPKAEAYFKELEQDKAATHTAYQYIVETIDDALAKKDLDQLLALIPYIETGDGSVLLKHVGEAHRILRILNIIALENKYHKTILSTGCSNKESLYEKYILILFALRRLLFCLSESSVNEAISFLQLNRPSVFAIYIIIKDDLIVPDEALYNSILSASIWDKEDQELFSSLITTGRS